jgi:predicted Zn-dependent protease
VVNCVRRDRESYRLSLFVARMPEEIRRHIRESGSPTAMVVVRDDAVRTSDPRGREALYQAACVRLETRQFERAVRAAARALNADPENRLYQALVHRALAETAYAEGRLVDAAWEVEKARACTPNDPHILVLRERVCGRRREKPAASMPS